MCVGGDVLDAPLLELLPYGEIANKHINQINDFYKDMEIEHFVIMPNHIHFMLRVFDYGAPRTSPPTNHHSKVSRFVSNFKRFCNKEIGSNIWQRGYYDHIIRNINDYERSVKYIYENPMRWQYDKLHSDEQLS